MKKQGERQSTPAEERDNNALPAVAPKEPEELSDSDLEGVSGGSDSSGSGVTWNP